MRAITCTQCGAIIDDVSESSLIINCEYCGARLLLPARPQQPTTEPVPFEDVPSIQVFSTKKMVFVVVGAIFAIPALIFLVTFANRPKSTSPRPVLARTTPVPVTYPTYQAPVVPQEPERELPVVNYQPRISWDGPNDLEHFESPEVDISSVAHLTSEEVEKTVFKNRQVKLKVIINTEGEIDEVETISGHPILAEAAANSAKRTIFSSRKKPTTRVLTYTFRVLKG